MRGRNNRPYSEKSVNKNGVKQFVINFGLLHGLLVQELTELHNRHWKIITIVREPVARNVSTFFHSIKLFMPDLDKKYWEGTITPEIMLNSFLTELDHDLSLKWFDVDVKSVFGIDVYEHLFPTEKGYGIISQDNVTFFIIRLEDLRQCCKDAFADFLGLADVDLKKRMLQKEMKSWAVIRSSKKTSVCQIGI